jgi:hypothetical protein
MGDQAGAYAYNSWWQFRADSWSRLEEATGRIVTALRRGKPIDRDITDAVHMECAALAPLEQFWAFPGHAAFGLVQELAAAGAWERLGRIVARINRALVTESYRTGFRQRYCPIRFSHAALRDLGDEPGGASGLRARRDAPDESSRSAAALQRLPPRVPQRE